MSETKKTEAQAAKVPIITNNRALQVENYHLEKLWDIGNDEEGIIFGEIRKVLLDGQGNLIVVDYGYKAVSMFSKDGVFLTELAKRAGDGGATEGEFTLPCDAVLIERNEEFPNDEHVGIVSRFGKRSLAVAKIGYSYEDQFPKMPDYSFLGATESFFGIMNVKRLRSGRHIFLRDTHTPGGTGARFMRYLSSTDINKNMIDYAQCSYVIPDPGEAKEADFDQLENYWDADDNLIFAALSDDYEISVFKTDTAEPLFVIRGEINRCTRKKDETRFLKDFFYDRFSRHAREVKIVPRERHRAVTGIALQKDGNVWATTLSSHCDRDEYVLGEFDVYNKNGHLLKRVRLVSYEKTPGFAAMNRLLLTNDRLYLTRIGEGNPAIYAYDLPKGLIITP